MVLSNCFAGRTVEWLDLVAVLSLVCRDSLVEQKLTSRAERWGIFVVEMVIRNRSTFQHDVPQIRPFRANSIFLIVSSSLKPPLLAHTDIPSPSSTLSSTSGKGQGQW